ncbi:M48 family metallopeptidase [Loktanella agnita]|uniref:M48 family metallopeptidase n=1 Tax=Loktanella agnita TaxID=287097 RepID=UPI0039886649
MGRHRLEGNPPIDVTLRRSARAKRLSLRVSRLDGRVTLTLPKRAREGEGIAFLQAKESWLRGHLDQMRPVQTVVMGQGVPVRGALLPIIPATGRYVRITQDAVHVVAGRPVGPQVTAALKALARDVLTDASDRYAAQVNRPYTRISLRDTRSRWGSCSSAGALMYSWRLIMAPSAVLDYVAAHEVAHLVEMNHGPAFWALVGRLCPDYDQHRRWLRAEGDQLHRITFEN